MRKIFGWEWSLITGNILDQNNVAGGCFGGSWEKWKGQIGGKILNCKARVQIGRISWCYLQTKSEQAIAKARKSPSMIIWKCDTLSWVAWVCSYLDPWYLTRQSCEVTFRCRSNEGKPWFTPWISASPFPFHLLSGLFISLRKYVKKKTQMWPSWVQKQRKVYSLIREWTGVSSSLEHKLSGQAVSGATF